MRYGDKIERNSRRPNENGHSIHRCRFGVGWLVGLRFQCQNWLGLRAKSILNSNLALSTTRRLPFNRSLAIQLSRSNKWDEFSLASHYYWNGNRNKRSDKKERRKKQPLKKYYCNWIFVGSMSVTACYHCRCCCCCSAVLLLPMLLLLLNTKRYGHENHTNTEMTLHA